MPGTKRKATRQIGRPKKKARTTKMSVGRFLSPGNLLASRFVIKRTVGGIDGSPNGSFGESFQLADVVNPSEFTSLFDMYKINKILYRFVVDRDSTEVTTATNRGFAVRVMFVHDHTDVSAPANFATLQEYQRCREIWLSTDKQRSKWFSLKPNTLDVGYTSLSLSNYAPNYSRWIDTANGNTPYYGLKVFYGNLYAGQQLYLECKYLMSFKGLK